MKSLWTMIGLVACALVPAGAAIAQGQPAATGKEASHAVIALPEAIDWQPAPPSLPPGARVAVLEGDPTRPGPFTMRLWMPAGYRIPPHFHPSAERVTVVAGIFHVGMGRRFDESAASALPPGTFASLGPEVSHYAFTRTETIIQLNNIGPWSLTYVDPADDPRRRP